MISFVKSVQKTHASPNSIHVSSHSLSFVEIGGISRHTISERKPIINCELSEADAVYATSYIGVAEISRYFLRFFYQP